MSDSGRVSLMYAAESTFAEVLGSGTKFNSARITGETLRRTADYIESEELRADRSVADQLLGASRGGGEIRTELRAKGHDDWLLALLQGTSWSSAGTPAAVSVTVNATTSVFTRASGSWVTDGFAANDMVRVSAFTSPNTGCNGLFRVAAVSATELTLYGQAVTAIASAATGTFTKIAATTNGVTKRSFNVVKKFTDLTNIFNLFTGVEFATGRLEITPGQIIKMSYTVGAKTMTRPTSEPGDGSPQAADTNSPMNAVRHVSGVTTGVAPFDITRLQLNFDNRQRERQQVSSEGPVSFGYGNLGLTAEVEGYFADGDEDMMDLFLADTPSDLTIAAVDANGYGYIIEIPRFKFTSYDTSAEAVNTDVIKKFAISAYLHPTKLYTVKVGKYSV